MPGTLVALVTGAALLTIACAPSPQPATPAPGADTGGPKNGGSLRVNVGLDPFNWDLTIQKTNPNDDGVGLAHDNLLSFKMGPQFEYSQMVLQPELAERWEISPDGRSFTFHLRKGARFQNLPPVNGREVTSADVKFAAEYRLRIGEFKDKGLPPADTVYIYEGLDRVDTPDPFTAVVRFKEPFVPFIAYAASDYNPIMPREIYDQDGSFQEKLIGAGPFILDTAASQKGTRWVFKKNPDYWDRSRPHLDEIRWLVTPQESTAQAAFQTKQLDILEPSGLDYEPAQVVKRANPEAAVYKWMEPRATQLYLSQKPERNSPVRDERVRRAISLAINRDEINKVISGGEGEWGMPGAMHGLFTEAEVKQFYKYDPTEAKRLLAEAGYANGMTLEWPVPNDEDQANMTILELVQAQLRPVGINVAIKAMDRATQRNIRRSYDFDIDYGTGLGGLHDDPDSLYFARFHSKSRGNYSVIRDPQLDKMLMDSRAESNLEKRRELLRGISRYVGEKMYYVELTYRPQWGFWHTYVKNYRAHFGSQAPYAFAWLDK